MAFNRDRNNRSDRSGGDRGGFRSRPSFGGRPRFGDRGDRGLVEMHKAICDNCGRECEVPFRPTSGKPIFCSSCFENQRKGSYSSFEKKNDFGGSRNAGINQGTNSNNQRFDELNSKLDDILKILTSLVSTDEVSEEQPAVQVKTTTKPKASRKKLQI